MLKVNGESCPISGGLSVQDLLTLKNFIFPLLIVKINGEFVPRESYKSTIIPEGAVVDVIHLISGG